MYNQKENKIKVVIEAEVHTLKDLELTLPLNQVLADR